MSCLQEHNKCLHQYQLNDLFQQTHKGTVVFVGVTVGIVSFVHMVQFHILGFCFVADPIMDNVSVFAMVVAIIVVIIQGQPILQLLLLIMVDIVTTTILHKVLVAGIVQTVHVSAQIVIAPAVRIANAQIANAQIANVQIVVVQIVIVQIVTVTVVDVIAIVMINFK